MLLNKYFGKGLASDLTCHFEETGIGVFWLHCQMFSDVPPDSKETELGSGDQEAFPYAGKNTGIVLVPCRAWKCVLTAIPCGVDI